MQKIDAVAQEFSAHSRDVTLGARRGDAFGTAGALGGIDRRAPMAASPAAPASRWIPPWSSALGLFGRVRDAFARATDRQLALAMSVTLFALAAWPLALVEVPPYQDLPNHLAAVTVITHPERYPEFVSNGFLKTNAALFTWLYFVGKVVGVKVAAKLFALLVLAANALVLPRFVLHFTNRRTMLVAGLFVWPMIHNWFVSMGMLDFAMGVPLALILLMLLDRRRTAPTWANGALVLATTLLTWYAHVFALMVANLLVAVHLVSLGVRTVRPREGADERARRDGRAAWLREAQRLIVPQLPAITLMLVSVYQHVTEPVGKMTGYVSTGQLLPPWELAYNLWAEWLYGFTWLSISSFVPAVVLTIYAYVHRKDAPTFFSPAALLTLLFLFVFSPYIATNWFHVNSRFIPFLWMAALVRLPERLDRRLAGLLALSAALYSVGMGVDFVRLDRDRAKFTAGMSAVPEGAKLLPLVFRRKLTSENTRSLLHAWGFYVMEKQTSAPLLFAHSRSFPVMYREAPPPQFNHLVLESFAPSMGTQTWFCDVLRSGGVFEGDCEGAWRAQWRRFWDQATREYDHLLVWDAPVEALAQIPPVYRIAFQQDRLIIFERTDAAGEAGPRASTSGDAAPATSLER